MKKKYDWDGWLALVNAGQSVTICYGEHYDVPQTTMCGQIRMAAYRRRVPILLKDNGASITVARGNPNERRGRPRYKGVTSLDNPANERPTVASAT